MIITLCLVWVNEYGRNGIKFELFYGHNICIHKRRTLMTLKHVYEDEDGATISLKEALHYLSYTWQQKMQENWNLLYIILFSRHWIFICLP